MDTMEMRLAALADRGFDVSVSIRKARSWDDIKGPVFHANLRKEGDSVARGGKMEASGYGATLDDAVGAALTAAEAFLGHPGPAQAVQGAIADMSTMLPHGAAE